MSDMSKLIRLVQQCRTISDFSHRSCGINKTNIISEASEIFYTWLPIRNHTHSNLSWNVCLLTSHVIFYHISSETCWWKWEISSNPMFRAFLSLFPRLRFWLLSSLKSKYSSVCSLHFNIIEIYPIIPFPTFDWHLNFFHGIIEIYLP